MSTLHRIKINCTNGNPLTTDIEIDGMQLNSVSKVSFEIAINSLAKVTIELYADVQLLGHLENLNLIPKIIEEQQP